MDVAILADGAKHTGALGRLLSLLHLAVILWWLLDKSPAQRATEGLVSLFRQVLLQSPYFARLSLWIWLAISLSIKVGRKTSPINVISPRFFSLCQKRKLSRASRRCARICYQP